MKSFAAIAALAGVVAAQSTGVAPVYVTDVLTAYTTYCPSSTQITHNGVTYTVTSATTLTITNCPCTVTRPVSTPSASAGVPAPPAPSSGAPAPAPVPSSSGYFPAVPSPTTAPTPSAPTSSSLYTGAANKVQVAGAGIAALVGLAAAL